MKSKWTFSFLHFFTLNQKHEEVKSKEEITVRKKKFVPLNFLLIRLNLAFKETNGIIAYNFLNNFCERAKCSFDSLQLSIDSLVSVWFHNPL